MSGARITIRRTRSGTTIRATGSAAQALFEAITHGAESAKAATRPAPVFLDLVVDGRNNTYAARPFSRSHATNEAGLAGKRATCTAGEKQAIDALLAKAEPPLRLARIVSSHFGAPTKGCTLYNIEAEVA